MFKDRIDAGKQLAAALRDVVQDSDVIVSGIPREGVVVASEAARALEVDYACMVVCRIGMPCFPEVTLGAVDPDGEVTFDPSMQLTGHEVRRIGHSVISRITLKVEQCRGGAPEPDYRGKTAIVVDDIVSDAITATAAAGYLKRQGAAKLVLAAPIIVEASRPELESIYDQVISLHTASRNRGAGAYYSQADQLTDEEIEAVLKAAV